MSEKIEGETVKAYLLELGRENPDKTAACFYSDEMRQQMSANYDTELGKLGVQPVFDVDEYDDAIPETPCCIVGRMVYDFTGVEGLRELREGSALAVLTLEDLAEYKNTRTNVKVLEGLGFSDEAIVLASRAQYWQDMGRTWETATINAVAGSEEKPLRDEGAV